MAMETCVLGGGCFWCLDATFRLVEGVEEVVCGYAGGHDPAPRYEAVCRGETGHAEVVELSFDPEVIGFRELLTIFFTLHDPTTLNRQGNDVGTQYRSAIYTLNEAQERQAREMIAELESDYADPIVTEVRPLDRFYPAEAYHQDYFTKNPGNAYCQFVIPPKRHKLARTFGHRLKG
ncbi:peptide-methionine (S)-S-oxide reductase MsrA [uncultured Halomonas sp.]|uniref:peptide-methionine (S)-S-oxide reductase MsrA n=1 Tax=uncultured Halomonas sp. TaxID=173971 RepID=UPI00261F6FDB|nr:peptide-methionine (S)-S-oxide reductase MsrA [uncultured Halomonas sp.]